MPGQGLGAPARLAVLMRSSMRRGSCDDRWRDVMTIVCRKRT